MTEVEPRWKEGPRRKKRAGGRAEPDRPMARRCEAAIALVCSGRAEHRHHVVRRSQGGDDGPSNTLDLCGKCHEYIHAHPSWARPRGLLGIPIETEESWPSNREPTTGSTSENY